jgi:hypothetical protein
MISYYKKQETLTAKVYENIANLPAGPRKIDTRSVDELRADWAKKKNSNTTKKS